MLFSALSLKVLVGLGAVVGVSVLSIHYTSKNTNTDALNSKPDIKKPTTLKQGVDLTPEPEEVDVASEQEIATIEDRIERLDKKISKPEAAEDVTPKQTEADIKANRSPNKKEKIANTQSKIATIESEIEKLKQEKKACYAKFTIANNDYVKKFDLYTENIQFTGRPEQWINEQDEWNNDKINAKKLLDEAEKSKIETKKDWDEKELSLTKKEEELDKEKQDLKKLNWT